MIGERERRSTLRVGSLMLLVAAMAVLFAAWRASPALAIAPGIPSTIALARTAWDRDGRSRRGPAAVFLQAFGASVFLAITAITTASLLMAAMVVALWRVEISTRVLASFLIANAGGLIVTYHTYRGLTRPSPRPDWVDAEEGRPR